MTKFDLIKVFIETNNCKPTDIDFVEYYSVWLESLCTLIIPDDITDLEKYIRETLLKSMP